MTQEVQRRMSMFPTFDTWLKGLLFGLSILVVDVGYGAEDWKDFSQKLQERRLFRLADIYLDEQIKQAPQGSVVLRDMYIRRADLLTQWAVNEPPQQRSVQWNAVDQVLRDAREQLRDPQSKLLLEIQQALKDLKQARTLREEDEWAASRDPKTQVETLNLLRSTRQRFEEAEKTMTRLMTDRNARYLESWSAEQWIALRRNTRYHRARSAFERAYWYADEDRLNRVEALQSASATLQDVAGQLGTDEPLWWDVVLAQVRALRQLQQDQEAWQLLRKIDLATAPLKFRPWIVAEVMRLQNALGEATKADQIATAILQGEFGQDPEALLAVLELMLDRFKEKNQEAFQTQAVAIAREIESRFGSYWGRRANRMLVRRSGGGNAPLQNLEVSIRIADETFLKGEWKEALTNYERALEVAQKANDQRSQVILWARTAAIYQQTGEHARAARHFFKAAELSETQTEAGEFAFSGVSNLQAASRGQADVSDDAYRQSLADFLQRYSDHARVNQVRLAGAAFEWQQGRLETAIPLALEIPLEAEEFEVASKLIELIIDQDRTSTGVDPGLRRRLLGRLETLTLDDNGAVRQPITEGRQAVAVLWSRLKLKEEASSRSQIADVLITALNAVSEQNVDSGWHDQARLLIIAVLAGLPARHAEVPPLLDSLTNQEPESLLDILQELKNILKTLGRDDRLQVAQWQLQLIDRCLKNHPTLETSMATRLRVARAWALAYQGADSLAVQELQGLLDQRPQDGLLQETMGEVLNLLGKPYIEKALAQWRLLASRSQPRTDRWYRARYWVIRLTAESGDRKRATQLLNYLKAVPPGWSDASNREQFEELAKDLL